MKTRPLFRFAPLALFVPLAGFGAAKGSFDVPPMLKRQATVQLAQTLATRTTPPPISPDLPTPFNPPEFDKPVAAPAESSAAGPSASGPKTAGATTTPGATTGAGAVTPPAPPAGDRTILEIVAAKIPALGSAQRGGKPLLLLAGGKRVEIGSSFTVSYDGQDYDLEVIAIDRTTFTLRYRGEEITRSIRLTK